MDPNEALRLAREAAEKLQEHLEQGDAHIDRGAALEAAESLREHFAALDEWISRGGFLPEAWQQS